VVNNHINLPNSSYKGNRGRFIPLHKSIRENLELLAYKKFRTFELNSSFIIRTERSVSTTAQEIINLYQSWYLSLSLIGCSSYSDRRIFITETSKIKSLVGSSLSDIQMNEVLYC
jgi:hypothetical protein